MSVAPGTDKTAGADLSVHRACSNEHGLGTGNRLRRSRGRHRCGFSISTVGSPMALAFQPGGERLRGQRNVVTHSHLGARIDAGKAAAACAGLSDGRLTPWTGSHRRGLQEWPGAMPEAVHRDDAAPIRSDRLSARRGCASGRASWRRGCRGRGLAAARAGARRSPRGCFAPRPSCRVRTPCRGASRAAARRRVARTWRGPR